MVGKVCKKWRKALSSPRGLLSDFWGFPAIQGWPLMFLLADGWGRQREGFGTRGSLKKERREVAGAAEPKRDEQRLRKCVAECSSLADRHSSSTIGPKMITRTFLLFGN